MVDGLTSLVLPDTNDDLKVLSDSKDEFNDLKNFLERWGAKQEVLLQETLDKIVATTRRNNSYDGLDYSRTLEGTVRSTAVEDVPVSPDELYGRYESERIMRYRLSGTKLTKVWVAEENLHAVPKCMQAYCAQMQTSLINGAERCLNSSTPPRGRLAKFLKSKYFEMLSAAVIISNAIWLAWSTDQEVKASLQQSQPSATTATIYEASFAAFYTVEILGRMYCDRALFVFTSEWKWNLLDTFLVVLALEDLLVVAIEDKQSKTNFTFLRLIRILKLARTLRIIRIFRIFKELRLIMSSILGSVQSMLWACILIIVVTFTFGILVTQGVSNYLQEYPDDIDPQSTVLYYWGSVSTSMLSLYLAVFQGENWREMADCLSPLGQGFRFSVFFFVGFFLLVIINTVTSLFVGSAIKWAERDQDAFIRAEVERKHEYVRRLKEVFKKLDSDGSGVLSYEEFLQSLNKPEILAFFSALELDVHDAKTFFKQISLDGEARVDISSFVVNCMKCRGWARSIDLLGFIGAQRVQTDCLLVRIEELAESVKDLKERIREPRRICSPAGSPNRISKMDRRNEDSVVRCEVHEM